VVFRLAERFFVRKKGKKREKRGGTQNKDVGMM
jgi:hypothetical protein